MSLKMNFTIPNKAIHIFIGLAVIAVLAAGTYAWVVNPGAVPNPGHSLDSIQGYFQGDASLRASLGKLCGSDGTNCTAVGDNLGNHIATQNLSLGNNKITNLINPTGNLDGVNKQYADALVSAATGVTCVSLKCPWFVGNFTNTSTSADLPNCAAPACAAGWVSSGTGCATASVAGEGSFFRSVGGYCERWCCQ